MGDVSGAEPFQWSEVRRGALSLQTLLTASAYFWHSVWTVLVWTLTTITNDLWSVVSCTIACVATVLVAVVSDRLKVRGVVMLCTLPIAIAGYAAIANISSSPFHYRTKYGTTFLMATGLSSSVPPVLVWISNNSAGHYKRATATATALQLAIANCGGFVTVFVYPPKPGSAVPQRAHNHLETALLWLGCVNKRKADGKEEKWRGCGDDRDPFDLFYEIGSYFDC